MNTKTIIDKTGENYVFHKYNFTGRRNRHNAYLRTDSAQRSNRVKENTA